MGPCEWPVDYAGCAASALPSDAPPEQVAERAKFEQMAAEFLWRWTGRQFGRCEVSIRPCRIECGGEASTFWGRGPFLQGSMGWAPVLVGGQWFNVSCGTCKMRMCSCDHLSSITLAGPVDSIVEVRIDGDVLEPSAYRVDNHRYLVRTDGGQWPRCQDLGKPPTEEGTWEVTYLRGSEVPVGGQMAAAILAVELQKAACKDRTCALPQRVQTITRQDVTVAVLDQFEDVARGSTGIWLIDSWVSSVTKAPQPSFVRSVDLPAAGRRGRVQTWP